MKSNRTVVRFFAVATLLGVLTLSTGTALHPMSADPSDAAAAFAEYAVDRYWIWSHLAQFVGVVLLALALIAFTLELEEGRSAPWGGISVALAIGLIAVAAVLQAVDGVALKRMVDRWAAAAAELKSDVFEAAFAIRQIEIGLTAFLSFVTGLAVTAFGLSLLFNSRGFQWFAWAALSNGIVFSGAERRATDDWLFWLVDDRQHGGEFPLHDLDGCARVTHMARS
jgi:hypothetical protein